MSYGQPGGAPQGNYMDALKNFQSNLDDRSNGIIFRQKDITAETDIRILPHLPHMLGLYCIERKVWWIDKKPYVSPATFGEPCPIEMEVAAARVRANDPHNPDLQLKAILDDTKGLSLKTSFYFPFVKLQVQINGGGQITAVIPSPQAQVMDCGITLIREINACMSSRDGITGSEQFGVTDRVLGKNFTCSKTGKDLNTEYKAKLWPFAAGTMEMDPKYYAPGAIPDVVDLTRKEIKSTEVMRSAIRHRLYGEPLLQEGQAAPIAGGRSFAAPAPTQQQQYGAPAPQYAQQAPVGYAPPAAGLPPMGAPAPQYAAPAPAFQAPPPAALPAYQQAAGTYTAQPQQGQYPQQAPPGYPQPAQQYAAPAPVPGYDPSQYATAPAQQQYAAPAPEIQYVPAQAAPQQFSQGYVPQGPEQTLPQLPGYVPKGPEQTLPLQSQPAQGPAPTAGRNLMADLSNVG